MADITGTASIGNIAVAAASGALASIVLASASVGNISNASAGIAATSSLTFNAAVGNTGVGIAELTPNSNVLARAEVGDISAGVLYPLISSNIEFNAQAKVVAQASIVSSRVNGPVFFEAIIGNLSESDAVIYGGSDTEGLSICDILDRTLEMWGIFCRKNTSTIDFAIDRAVSDLNHALQLVWNNAEGRTYWTNETITVTVDADASSEDLPDNIQNVTGTCRRADNKQPLTLIGTIGELETFNDTFLDGERAETPIAYHIERLKQSGNEPARCIFHVNQAVDENTDFLLEIVREAPRYSKTDLDTCPLIPIPHQYVESLLLPIVRYQASNFYLFRQMDLKEDIKAEYAKAMAQLGLSDPLPNHAGDNKQNGGEG